MDVTCEGVYEGKQWGLIDSRQRCTSLKETLLDVSAVKV